MSRRLALGLTLILAAHTPAEACGHRRASRMQVMPACRPMPVVYYYAVPPCPPTVYHAAPRTPTPTPQAVPAAAPIPRPVAATPVQAVPASPAPDPSTAYYYTYDDSGKLIVRRWMDWLYRGGREAGLPAPPLPVIGWFTGR